MSGLQDSDDNGVVLYVVHKVLMTIGRCCEWSARFSMTVGWCCKWFTRC